MCFSIIITVTREKEIGGKFVYHLKVCASGILKQESSYNCGEKQEELVDEEVEKSLQEESKCFVFSTPVSEFSSL